MKFSDSKFMQDTLQDYKKQQKESEQDDYFKKASHTSSPSRFLSEYQIYNEEHAIQHSPYSNEKLMLDALSRGDEDTFMKASKNSLQFSFGQMSSTNEKSLEYQCVIGVSLFARAAIEGGVDPIRGYNLNDLFLQRISKCNTYEEYMAVMTDAIESFFLEVGAAKAVTHHSIHLEKAKQYIANHISNEFTIQDLADYLAINKAYLMRLFRKYEDCTVTDYIHKERILAAKNMLTYSDYSIGEIAQYLRFSSQSYFGRVFKELTGMTPYQFRLLHIRIPN